MDTIFDKDLIEANRLRALRLPEGPADFLLDVAAGELAERLGVVERHFERAVELHGYTGQTARAAFATGKIGGIERVETDSRLAGPGETVTVSPGQARRMSVSTRSIPPIFPVANAARAVWPV